MITTGNVGEGTTSKYRTVVESFWAMVSDPAVALSKPSKSAAKLNLPKSKKYQDT